MKGWAASLAVLVTAGVIFATPANAQSADPSRCELHIWPTAQFGAVYHGSEVGFYNGMPGISMYLSPMEEVARRVSVAVDPGTQVRRMQDMHLEGEGRFAGYEVIFHEAPAQSPFANWVDRNVGQGPRLVQSSAPCYAELHVIFITLFRTALSKKIQTGFVFREFGESGDAVFTRADAGSTGAPAFDTGATQDSDEARVSVQDAFVENIRILLRSRRMRQRG